MQKADCSGRIFEFAWAVVLALLVLIIAWQLHGGNQISWTAPLAYDGDSLFYLITIKRLAEGSGYFINARQGYPFLSYLFDFPGSDAGSLLALWIGAKLTGSEALAHNAYYLLGFPLAALAAFWTLRKFDLSRAGSAACGLLFSAMPFHFLRLPHLYYTWYFVIPFFCWYAAKLFDGGEEIFGSNAARKTRGVHCLALVALACFGVYYAWFGSIVLFIGGVFGSLRHRSRRPFLFGLAAVFSVALGVALNLMPNVWLMAKYGKNGQIAKRVPWESEVLGLKIVQMLLPRLQHRSETLANLNKEYSRHSPNVNENVMSTLGFVGGAGFVLLLYAALVHSPRADGRVRLLFLFGTISLLLVLIATIGGFSALFAQLITPQFRGWNRVSIFIGFMSLIAVAIKVDGLLANNIEARSRRRVRTVLFIAIGCFGLWDQTTQANVAHTRTMQADYLNDAAFFRAVQQSLPAGSAIYQLPFMFFPEAPRVERLHSYDLGKGFLHSNNIKWSFGVAAGRDGSDFLANLAREPIPIQLEIARFLGFAGLLVDRRGYNDQAAGISAEIAHELIGVEPIEDESGSMLFYSLATLPAVKSKKELSPPARALIRQSAIRMNRDGSWRVVRSPYRVDFSLPLRSQLRSFAGISVPEPWGAWSEGKEITVRFRKALPKAFFLNIVAQGFGPNAGAPVSVRIGPYFSTFLLRSDMQSFALPVTLDTEQDSIQFIAPAPTSPRQLGINPDDRLLGIGFKSISIVE